MVSALQWWAACISLQGRFLAIAGFGNLPGDVVFFDKKPDGKCKQMGATRCGGIPSFIHNDRAL